jgi:hypothetical protein
MKQLTVVLTVFVLFHTFTIKGACPSTPMTKKAIQQRLIAIKRNATNLEQVLRKSDTVEQFYAAPPAAAQLKELTMAATELATCKITEKIS